MADLKYLAESWPIISRRLDEALALAPGQREAWLGALGEPEAVKAALRRLLGPPSAETGEILDTLPRLELELELAGPAPAPEGTEPGAAPGTLTGPYRLIRALGVGGMGQVWLAERVDGALKRQVALKLPRLGHSRGLAERMGRERDILASLDHPNIARLYDAGVDDQGQPYLALEFVEGVAIDVYCRTHALSLPDRLALVLQVARAVAHAHARLVVHRDLKPANILVTDQGEVRLLDFGIAKLLEAEPGHDSQLTLQAGRALTLDYASPEQIRGDPIGTASDVYSLGVVAYELLAETKPYQLKRQSAAALEEAIESVDVRPASSAASRPELRRALKGDLDAILNKALKKRVTERYPTVEALAQDIERHLASLPVQARPDALGYRARKFLRRNALAVLASAAVATAVVVGAGAALWQASLAHEQARIAKSQAELANRNAQHAQAVQRFLLDIFRANSDQQQDPVKARHATARELLDIGATRLQSQLLDAPQARLEVMETLGEMYYQLQLDEQATAIDSQRIALLRQVYGSNDRRVAEALVNLAAALHATSRRDEILPTLDEARRILDANGDQTSRLRGELLTRLAQRHQNLSLEKMKAYADEALQVLRPHAVANESRLYTALVLAARARMQLGEPADAERLFREALAELSKAKPVAQVALIQGRIGLVESLVAQLKFDEALRESRDTAEGAIAGLGLDDPGTIVAQSRLAALLHATGQRAQGRELHRATLQRVLQVKGADDTLYTPIVRMDFGRSLLAEGRLREALDLIAAVNASNRRHYAGSVVLGNGLRVEATILSAMGRYAEARALFAEGAELWRKGVGGDVQASRLNRFHLDEARLDLALRDATGAMARLGKVAAPGNAASLPLRPEEIERDVLLSSAHLQLGSVERALALADGAAARLAASSLRTDFAPLDAEVTLQLGQALLGAGRPAAARAPIEQALAWRVANDDPDSPWIAEAAIAQARCLLALGERARAVAAVRQAAKVIGANKVIGDQFTAPLRELQLATRTPPR